MSPAEQAILRSAVTAPPGVVRDVRRQVRAGADPLGDAFCRLRTPAQRRPNGATFTPRPIVAGMIAWAKAHGAPARIVDPGTGSGRFLVAAGRAFADAELVGVEIDPVAALLARAHLAAAGLARRARVVKADYREIALPTIAGRTLFIGNPPYVRHHLVTPAWKAWLTATAAARGHRASQLAGLHVHFYLATLEKARKGDYGTFITSAEWLDVNYGSLLRGLLLDGLGGSSIQILEPTSAPFEDAATTAAITCFEVGSRPIGMVVRCVPSIDALGDLAAGTSVSRERLARAPRWSGLSRTTTRRPAGFVELGELCRVHRGQVTGANHVWIHGAHSADLPVSVLRPTVTKAKELFGAGESLCDSTGLRRLIDLPVELDVLTAAERRRVERFLASVKRMGVDRGYIASHRPAWWAVGLRAAAPILATYMARRPPAFVRNLAAARHINIAHGLYPREPMTARALSLLAGYLANNVALAEGRTYAGGLTKFEPKEMERLWVPSPVLFETANETTWPRRAS